MHSHHHIQRPDRGQPFGQAIQSFRLDFAPVQVRREPEILVKTGAGYMLPGEAGSEPALPPVSRLVREFVLEVRAAQNQLVIKTTVGSAQPVAAALDGQDWEEAIGTIAGDDTILMVCVDKKGANRLAARIQEMLA